MDASHKTIDVFLKSLTLFLEKIVCMLQIHLIVLAIAILLLLLAVFIVEVTSVSVIYIKNYNLEFLMKSCFLRESKMVGFALKNQVILFQLGFMGLLPLQILTKNLTKISLDV